MACPENHLIALLPRRDRESLLAACEPVLLEPGAVLCEPHAPTAHVYFPEHGFISLVTAIDGVPALEVGLVGREGMLGVQLALGVDSIPLHALVQGPGTAQRIAALPFRRLLDDSPALRSALHRYVYVLMAQLAIAAGCTRFHKLGPRLARWLLMTGDRAQADSFHLTHDLLSRLLGVRRVGITGAAGDLQRRGLIRYHRGHITVLDRSGLEAAACSCYAADLHAYDATVNGSGASSKRRS